MYSSCKRSISRNATWSAIYISLQRSIPKFDTVLLHSNWSSPRRKYLSKTPTDVNALSCGAKTWNISGISNAISLARHQQKSSQHARACAAGDGAICSKNRIIIPYHGDNPNTWNGARLRSPSPIMAPASICFSLLAHCLPDAIYFQFHRVRFVDATTLDQSALFLGRKRDHASLQHRHINQTEFWTLMHRLYTYAAAFTLWKHIKCFPSTPRRRNLKTQQSLVMGFVFEEKSGKEITWLSWRHRFRKSPFSNCFPYTNCTH